MKKLIIISLVFNFFSIASYSQGQYMRVIDSLILALNSTNTDTGKVNTLNQICNQYLSVSNSELALKYALQSLSYGESVASSHKENNDEKILKRGIATAYNNIGRVYLNLGDYAKAMNYFLIALKIREEIADEKAIAASYNNIALIYNNQGNYEKALENHLKSLAIKEKINDRTGIAMSYNNIGVIYQNLGNYEKSLENHLKSLAIKEDMGDVQGIAMSYNNIGIIYEKRGDSIAALDNYMKFLKAGQETGNKQYIANAYNNIGNIYLGRKDYKKALDFQMNSLKIKEEIGDKAGIAMSYNNIGTIYEMQENHKEALENQLKSLKIAESIGDTQQMSISSNNVGNIYLKMEKPDQALQHNKQALEWAQKIGYKAGIKESFLALANVYETKKDYTSALKYYKYHSEIKDTLLNEQSSKQIAEMNIKYDSEKKDKELIKKDAEINWQQAETEKKNLQRNAFIVGLLLMMILAFYVYRGYRQKQTANLQLEEKNTLIEKQKHLVEEKNNKITDSITYAKRIQQATLPSEELIKTAFPDSFIVFLPRDIVSGDFYWYSQLPTTNSQLIVVADCTGHGVPGAFMSMIGNTLLNEIVNVKGIHSPADILNELNKGVVSLLNQTSDDINSQEDGMDITIVSIDKSTNIIEYATANHSSYIMTQNELKLLKGDIYSIGGMFGKPDIKFSSQKIKMEKGNTLYLFTDGYIDQFGGKKNSKYSSNRFEELLKNSKHLNMQEQKTELIAAFENWKETNKQLDDILVVGIQF